MRFIRHFFTFIGLWNSLALFVKHLDLVELPCASQICAQLEKDPINRIIPLPFLGLGLYTLQFLISLSPTEIKGGKVLSGCAAVTSASLTLYASQKYNGVCPYCICSAVCCLGIYITDQLNALKTTKIDPQRMLIASIIATVTFGGLVYSQEKSTANISRLTVSETFLTDRALSSAPTKRIVFVDFECTTCRTLLRKIVGSPVATSIVMVTHDNEFSIAESLGFHTQISPETRRSLIRKVIDSPSLPLHSVERLFGAVTPAARFKLSEDTELTKRLEIRATPVVIERKGSKWELVPFNQLL
jgi:uncharacterized membrane protein